MDDWFGFQYFFGFGTGFLAERIEHIARAPDKVHFAVFQLHDAVGEDMRVFFIVCNEDGCDVRLFHDFPKVFADFPLQFGVQLT